MDETLDGLLGSSLGLPSRLEVKQVEAVLITMPKSPGRVFHITRKKCGSQWVRDVLSAPEITFYSHCPHSGVVSSSAASRIPDAPDHTFTGPVYGISKWEWQHFKRQGDKAVVVLRDPRDAAVSWMYSMLCSHSASARVNLARRLLHALPDQHTRLMQVVYEFGSGGGPWFYRSWFAEEDIDALMITYEELVLDQQAGFSRIVEWLGWEVPAPTLHLVVDRLSFEKRCGRKAGETDNFSHYRRGVVGDWRNHFDRAHGERWEEMCPSLLSDIGYESSSDWWRLLPDPERSDVTLGQSVTNPSRDKNLLLVLEKRLLQAEHELEEKERVIRELLGKKSNSLPL